MTPRMQPENPFVGLRPFRSEESLLFFGRRQQTVELLEQLHRTRFLAVVGSSGSGKSSLVSAGLIPRLKGGFLVEDRDRWMLAVLKPGDAPLHSLATAVVAAVEEKVDARGVARQLEEMRACGARAISERLAPALEKSDANFLLLVDQFEELFRFGLHTGSPERRDQAADFVSILLGLAAQHDAPVFVVITMRSDFLGDCDAFHGLPEAMNRSQYLVPRLTRAQRREAVEGPVRLFGERISPQLLDRVLNDAGDEPDQLPIMQHALLRTWENWGKNGAGPLDVADYLATGAMKEALSRDAEAVLAEMSEEERKLAKRIFQALTDTDPGNRRIRRPARLSDLAGVANASRDAVMNVVDRFCGGGRSFLVVSEDPASGDALIDISHESLIRQWETLRIWVDEEAESRRIYLDIVDSVVRKKGLWRDPYLQVALDWRDRARPNDIWARRYHAEFAGAMAFLDDSKANRDREALEKLRQQRLRRRLTTALFTVSVVFVAVVAYLVYRAERWEREAAEELAMANAEAEEIRRSAQATTSQALAMLRDSEEGAREERFKAGQEHNRLLGLRLALEASRQFDDSPDGLIRSALVAIESLKSGQTVEGAKVLMQALRLIPPAPDVIPNVHKGRIGSLVFSPGGRWLATGGYQDGNVIIWDWKDRKKRFLLETKRSLVLSLAFSADSRWLATGANRAVFLWNTETGKPLRDPLEHQNAVRSVAFSADGKLLATTEQAGRLRIFATEAWTPLGDKPGEQQPYEVIFFGNKLLLATSQGIYSDGQRVHQGQCHSLAVSGSNIAAACREGIVLLEGSEDWARIPGQYNTVTLFPDGQFVAGGGRIFDVRSREERTRITKPTQSLAFSPDGRHIVTGGPDGALTFWPTDEGTEAIRLPYRGSVTALPR